jgi:hypothetical protein
MTYKIWGYGALPRFWLPRRKEGKYGKYGPILAHILTLA